jgi:hypothetical protein
MSRKDLDLDFSDAPEEDREPAHPERREERQRAEAERLEAQQQQPDTGRHGEDRSRPSSFQRKMH